MGGGAVPNVAVRFGSGRFDTILGESIVETAMISHSLTHSLTDSDNLRVVVLLAGASCMW